VEARLHVQELLERLGRPHVVNSLCETVKAVVDARAQLFCLVFSRWIQ